MEQLKILIPASSHNVLTLQDQLFKYGYFWAHTGACVDIALEGQGDIYFIITGREILWINQHQYYDIIKGIRDDIDMKLKDYKVIEKKDMDKTLPLILGL